MSGVLLNSPFVVVMFFLIEDGLKEVFAASFVHVENSGRDYVLDLIVGKVVHQGPVILVHVTVLLHSFVCILGNMRPSFLRVHIIIHLRVILLHLGNLLNLNVGEALRTRKLLHHSLHLSVTVSLMNLFFCFQKIIELHVFSILKFLSFYLFKVYRFLFKGGFMGRIFVHQGF